MRHTATFATAATLALALGSFALAQTGGGASGGAVSPGSGGASTQQPPAGATQSQGTGAGGAMTGGGMTGSGTTGSGSAGAASGGAGDSAGYWRRVSQAWTVHQGEVQRQWTQLTEADLRTINGDRALLVQTITRRYGVPQTEAERQVSEFEKRQSSTSGAGGQPGMGASGASGATTGGATGTGSTTGTGGVTGAPGTERKN